MVINFSRQVYKPTFDVWARPVTFYPTASQPGQPAYTGRGIYSSQPMDIPLEAASIFSDNATILDVLDDEFDVVPAQGDTLLIDAYADLPSLGNFMVVDDKANGGGETSLVLQKLVVAKP